MQPEVTSPTERIIYIFVKPKVFSIDFDYHGESRHHAVDHYLRDTNKLSGVMKNTIYLRITDVLDVYIVDSEYGVLIFRLIRKLQKTY